MKYAKAPTVHVREMEQETYLLDERTGTFHGLNTTATAIWHVLASGGTAEDAASALIDEYDVTMDRAMIEVEAFVHTLTEMQVVFPSDVSERVS